MPDAQYALTQGIFAYEHEFQVNAIAADGSEGEKSPPIKRAKLAYTEAPRTTPKTRILYNGNGTTTFATTDFGEGWITAPNSSVHTYNRDGGGSIFCFSAGAQTTFSSAISNAFGSITGLPVNAPVIHGNAAYPRPNPEIIPRPNGKLLLIFDAAQAQDLKADITVNGLPRAQGEQAWQKIPLRGQWVHRLNVDIGASEGDDVCVALHSLSTGATLREQACQPFIRMEGSLFGQVESFSVAPEQKWHSNVVVKGWYSKDFQGQGGGYPQAYDVGHRLGGSLPNSEEATLSAQYPRPDIVARYGDEFFHSVRGFDYTIHPSGIISRHGMPRDRFSVTLRVYDQAGHGRVLYNGGFVVDIRP